MTFISDIQADLGNMLDDWGDSITIGGTEYDGLYDQEFIESGDYAGFTPVFTLAASDATASGVARGTDVTVTSALNALTDQAYTVRVVQTMGDGVTKLILTE